MKLIHKLSKEIVVKTGLLGELNDKSFHFHIISEPGDCTRYDYYVRVGEHLNTFMFTSSFNSFPYPELITEEELSITDDYGLLQITRIQGCNFHTLVECMETARYLKNKIEGDTHE